MLSSPILRYGKRKVGQIKEIKLEISINFENTSNVSIFTENLRINDIVFSLKERGHHVEVLTGKQIILKENILFDLFMERSNVEDIKGVKTYRSNLILRKKGIRVRLFKLLFICLFCVI